MISFLYINKFKNRSRSMAVAAAAEIYKCTEIYPSRSSSTNRPQQFNKPWQKKQQKYNVVEAVAEVPTEIYCTSAEVATTVI